MFMSEQSIKRYEDVQYPDVRLYLTKLFEEKFSRKSVARKISSLRSFYKFLLREKMVTSNPFSQVSIPKAEKRLPDARIHQVIIIQLILVDLNPK